MIVTALNLDMPPADIEPDAPLFGEGLGLDSIDVLEISLVVSKSTAFSSNRTTRTTCASSRRCAPDHPYRLPAHEMTLSPGQLLRGLAVVVFLVVWALLAHSGSAGEGSADLSVLLGVAPLSLPSACCSGAAATCC